MNRKKNADLAYDFASPKGHNQQSKISSTTSWQDASTERYCQSPTTDNKGVFSYHELLKHTPCRTSPSRHYSPLENPPSESKQERIGQLKHWKQDQLAKGQGEELLEIVKLNTACQLRFGRLLQKGFLALS